ARKTLTIGPGPAVPPAGAPGARIGPAAIDGALALILDAVVTRRSKALTARAVYARTIGGNLADLARPARRTAAAAVHVGFVAVFERVGTVGRAADAVA